MGIMKQQRGKIILSTVQHWHTEVKFIRQQNKITQSSSSTTPTEFHQSRTQLAQHHSFISQRTLAASMWDVVWQMDKTKTFIIGLAGIADSANSGSHRSKTQFKALASHLCKIQSTLQNNILKCLKFVNLL